MTKFKANKSKSKPNDKFKKKFNKFNKFGNDDKKDSKGKNKKKPVNLVFDPEARKDFLTGFHKRKLEKKQHYRIKLTKQVAEEKQRLQAQARKPVNYKSSSHSILPEVEALLALDAEEQNPVLNNQESFEVGSKTVTISSIDHSLHGPIKKEEEEDDEEDEAEPGEEMEQDQTNEHDGKWKQVTKKGKSKMVFKSDTNRLLQNTAIFKKIQKLKQKSKKHRPKPNPHFTPKAAANSDIKSKGGSSSKPNMKKGSSKTNMKKKGGKPKGKKGKSKGK